MPERANPHHRGPVNEKSPWGRQRTRGRQNVIKHTYPELVRDGSLGGLVGREKDCNRLVVQPEAVKTHAQPPTLVTYATEGKARTTTSGLTGKSKKNGENAPDALQRLPKSRPAGE